MQGISLRIPFHTFLIQHDWDIHELKRLFLHVETVEYAKVQLITFKARPPECDTCFYGTSKKNISHLIPAVLALIAGDADFKLIILQTAVKLGLMVEIYFWNMMNLHHD
uniref:Uncharacterized protein n=1 Tax=Rhizophagus irregularis (strain DAOM 181602 / DAOM 197198 / MUCL 43194) TaxID=747089 RepID=U9UF52_RHIID